MTKKKAAKGAILIPEKKGDGLHGKEHLMVEPVESVREAGD